MAVGNKTLLFLLSRFHCVPGMTWAAKNRKEAGMACRFKLIHIPIGDSAFSSFLVRADFDQQQVLTLKTPAYEAAAKNFMKRYVR